MHARNAYENKFYSKYSYIQDNYISEMQMRRTIISQTSVIAIAELYDMILESLVPLT